MRVNPHKQILEINSTFFASFQQFGIQYTYPWSYLYGKSKEIHQENKILLQSIAG
jgi:hypothetical protein